MRLRVPADRDSGAQRPGRKTRARRQLDNAVRTGPAPDVMPPVTNSDGWRRAEVPAGNGHGNARSLVRAQTAVANGGSAFGVNLISPAAIEQIFREQGVIIDSEIRHGIGYGLTGMGAANMRFGLARDHVNVPTASGAGHEEPVFPWSRSDFRSHVEPDHPQREGVPNGRDESGAVESFN